MERGEDMGCRAGRRGAAGSGGEAVSPWRGYPVKEITSLITAQRSFEMNSKVIQAVDEMAGTISCRS
jgi:hypothetical protein